MSYLLRYLGTVNPMARQELEINMTSVTNKYKMWVHFLNDLPRLCHPLALASIFTRRIYSLPWCAPGQSQIWENNLFEFKLFNDNGYLVFNCKNWLEISIFVYFCRLGRLYKALWKERKSICMFRLNWVTRTMQEICRDLYSHVWWCFFKVSKDNQDNLLSVKMKTKETKSRPSVLSSHSRLEFTCWVPTSNHKRKAWTIQKRHVEIHVEHPVCRFLEWVVFLTVDLRYEFTGLLIIYN